MLEEARPLAQPVPPCAKCGARRRGVGVVPHLKHQGIKVRIYRCVSCDERSEEMVRME
jgi:hypothetical protein